MSRIYFHNINATAEVSGRERGLMGSYCSDALLFALGDLNSFGTEKPWILNHIPSDCYLHRCNQDHSIVNSVQTWLRVSGGGLLLNGKTIPLFHLQLNSVMAIGGNALKLAARLHGQCEIHCYVEGQNRNWLAGMIDDALMTGIFREDHGWESVCELLRKENNSPVVCSYSVCDSFPNRHVAEWEPEKNDEDGDGWYDIPKEKQWEMAMAGLRKNGGGLELTPDGWDEFYFGSNPISGFNFRNK